MFPTSTAENVEPSGMNHWRSWLEILLLKDLWKSDDPLNHTIIYFSEDLSFSIQLTKASSLMCMKIISLALGSNFISLLEEAFA